jgi:MULE transposase domain/SWIM zinc finger
MSSALVAHGNSLSQDMDECSLSTVDSNNKSEESNDGHNDDTSEFTNNFTDDKLLDEEYSQSTNESVYKIDGAIKEHILKLCEQTNLPNHFNSRNEAKYIIRLSQCKAHRSFKVPKSDKNLYKITCAHPTCEFFLCVRHTMKLGEHLYAGNGLHSCEIVDHTINKYQSPASCVDFLSRYIKENYGVHGITSATKLQSVLVNDLGCSVPMSTIQRALTSTISLYHYHDTVGYGYLVAYEKRINNNGGYAVLKVVDCEDSSRSSSYKFNSMFVCLKEQRKYANFIQYVCIDATHLNGLYGGAMMCASTLDPNGRVCILAQAVVAKENGENWFFFMQHLKNAGVGHNVEFFMSDRDKGLINAVETTFPNIPHSKCIRHLSENFKKKFGREPTQMLKRMATVFTLQEYNECRSNIEGFINGAKMIQWIDDAIPATWCRALFPCQRYGVTTSNTIEIIFSVFRSQKHLPTLQLLMYVERYVLQKRYEMVSQIMESTKLVVEKASKLIQNESIIATHFTCFQTDILNGTVQETSNTETRIYSVDISTLCCTCHRFQELGIPCRHAIKFLTSSLHQNPESYCNPIYNVSYLQRMYAGDIGHTSMVTTMDHLHEIGHYGIEPPTREEQRGRKRTKRIESQSKNYQRNSSNRVVVCPLCKKTGHYKKTCNYQGVGPFPC